MNTSGIDRSILKDAIRNRPALWLIKHQHYRNRNVQTAEWQKIKEETNAKESIEELKKIWKAIRDNDRRRVKRAKDKPSGSGGGGDVHTGKSEIEWIYDQEHYRNQSASQNIPTTSETTKTTTTIDIALTGQEDTALDSSAQAENVRDYSINSIIPLLDDNSTIPFRDENLIIPPAVPEENDIVGVAYSAVTGGTAYEENALRVPLYNRDDEDYEMELDQTGTQMSHQNEFLSQFESQNKAPQNGNRSESLDDIEALSDEETMENLFQNCSQQPAKLSKSKAKITKAKQDRIDKDILKSVKKISKHSKETKTLQSDPNYNFCLMLVQHLKTVPPARLIDVQKDILSIVQQYQNL